jgi:hypothetical protein
MKVVFIAFKLADFLSKTTASPFPEFTILSLLLAALADYQSYFRPLHYTLCVK